MDGRRHKCGLTNHKQDASTQKKAFCEWQKIHLRDILPAAVQHLELKDEAESLTLQTILQDVFRLITGALVEVTVLKATAEAVMPILCSTEHQLLKDPAKAKLYEAEIKKLIGGGALPSLVQKRWSQ